MNKKEIHDIFSKKTLKEGIKEKIIIDYREKNSLIPSMLIKEGFLIEFQNLKVGDYLVKDIIIERKTTSDFLASMFNGRLLKQLEELQQYERKILLIEGFEEKKLYNEETINPNSIRGFLVSILLNHKIPIIFSKNEGDSTKFISVISKKKPKESPLNVKKKSLNKKEHLQFILEAFPKIGPKKAKKLLEKFDTIKKIINSTEDELKNTIGKDAETIYKLSNESYK